MDFVEIASFATRLEAETVAHALDKSEIPYVIKDEHSSVFPLDESTVGHNKVSLCVSEDKADAAKEVLRGMIDEEPSEE